VAAAVAVAGEVAVDVLAGGEVVDGGGVLPEVGLPGEHEDGELADEDVLLDGDVKLLADGGVGGLAVALEEVELAGVPVGEEDEVGGLQLGELDLEAVADGGGDLLGDGDGLGVLLGGGLLELDDGEEVGAAADLDLGAVGGLGG
jgi:hypothetical protein